jgi:hypothetical protein
MFNELRTGVNSISQRDTIVRVWAYQVPAFSTKAESTKDTPSRCNAARLYQKHLGKSFLS